MKDPAEIAPEAERSNDPTPVDLMDTLEAAQEPTEDTPIGPDPDAPESNAPAAPVSAEAPAAPAAATPPPASEQIFDPARIAAMEQTLNSMQQNWSVRERGLLDEITRLRQTRRQEREQQQAQQPQVPSRIPVKFDENGNPYVAPEELAQFIRPSVDPVTNFYDQQTRVLQGLVLQEPVVLAPAARRFQEAKEAINRAVQMAQAHTGRETRDIDSMMDLVEESGIGAGFIKHFTDVAKDMRDVEDLIMAATSLNPKRLSKVLSRINTYRGSAAPAQEPAPANEPAPTPGPVRDDQGRFVKPATPKAPPAAPQRRMGDLGRGTSSPAITPGPSAGNGIESVLDWSPEKRASFLKEASRLDGDAQQTI